MSGTRAPLRYLILIGAGFVMLYPLLWMLGGAFKPNAEIFQSIGLFPAHPTLEGFTRGWRTGTEFSFATYLANTFRTSAS